MNILKAISSFYFQRVFMYNHIMLADDVLLFLRLLLNSEYYTTLLTVWKCKRFSNRLRFYVKSMHNKILRKKNIVKSTYSVLQYN